MSGWAVVIQGLDQAEVIKMVHPYIWDLVGGGWNPGLSWKVGRSGLLSHVVESRASPSSHAISRVVRHVTWQLRAPRSTTVEAAMPSQDLVLRLAQYHFCPILLVRALYRPAWEGTIQGCEWQKVWLIGATFGDTGQVGLMEKRFLKSCMGVPSRCQWMK